MKVDIEQMKQLLHSFEQEEESIELQKEYLYVFSNIKNFNLRAELKILERLLNNKNLFDMLYAYKCGRHYSNEYKNPLAERPLDDLVNTNRLYRIQEYATICEKSQTQRKRVYALAGDEINSVDLLFEIYSYYNYELIKYTFISAYNNR